MPVHPTRQGPDIPPPRCKRLGVHWASMSAVQMSVRSCWEGSCGQHTVTPLGELTYLGYLPVTLRTSLKGVGMSDRNLQKIARDTVKHCQTVTYKRMWIRRTTAMKEQGRTLAMCLRKAHMIAEVVHVDETATDDDVLLVIDSLQTESRRADSSPSNDTARRRDRNEAIYPKKTVVWEEPSAGGQGDVLRADTASTDARSAIRTGNYRYVVFTTRIRRIPWYVTVDAAGGRPRKEKHSTVRKSLVHTKGMPTRNAERVTYMRKAAVKIDGILHVVWGTQSVSINRHRMLMYAGGLKLTPVWDEDIGDHNWLKAGDYDTATRTALDAIWTEAGTYDLWYILGAHKEGTPGDGTWSTITNCEGEQWETQQRRSRKAERRSDAISRVLGSLDTIVLPGLEHRRDIVTAESELSRHALSNNRRSPTSGRQARGLGRRALDLVRRLMHTNRVSPQN